MDVFARKFNKFFQIFTKCFSILYGHVEVHMYVDIQVQQVLPIYKINNQGLQVAAIVGS